MHIGRGWRSVKRGLIGTTTLLSADDCFMTDKGRLKSRPSGLN
jgi:hypothetical protein